MASKPPNRAPTRLRSTLRHIGLTLGGIVLLGTLSLIPARPMPNVPLGHPEIKGESFDAFLAETLERSRAEGVLPGNDERLVRRSEKRSNIAILYIHGFTASRAEGEAVVDKLSDEFAANLYYMRLPGHGGGKEAHAAVRPEEYFERVEEAFHQTRTLGDKVVLIGTSLGGLLSIWLASRHPDDVRAVVLASPFLAFADPMSFLLSKRVGMPIIETIYGKERDASWKNDPEHRKLDGYEDHWVTRQYFRSLSILDDVRRTAATREVMSGVRAPVLLLYYFADETHQDTAASVSVMQDFFAMANGGAPHALSRKVAIADASHVLFSAHVRTDKEKILHETRAFFKDVLR